MFGGLSDKLSSLSLINALYFDAPWASEFEESNTSDYLFKNLDGSQSWTSFMNRSQYVRYYGDEIMQLASINYVRSGVKFMIILPKQGVDMQSALAHFKEYMQAEDSKKVEGNTNIHMPKFETSSELSLFNIYQSLGIKKIFDPEAKSFNWLCNGTNDKLAVAVCSQLSKISVSEKRTIVASVTKTNVGGLLSTNVAPSEDLPSDIYVDRPFYYAVYDESGSGALIAMGRVTQL